MKPSVMILGARGSVPVSGQEFSRYGGATTCIFVRLAGQPIILDCGTGLLNVRRAAVKEDTDLPILLSHPHVDHLLGLPMCPGMADPTRRFRIFAAPRGGSGPEEQVRALMRPPLWPVGPEVLAAELEFHPLKQSFSLGGVTVDFMEGNHPGGVTLFRLTGEGKRVACFTDCTLDLDTFQKSQKFAQNCDLLLCDGQYSPEEWPAYSTFGHSTWEMAARLGAACGAKQTRIIHHAPDRTDSQLDAAGAQLSKLCPNCSFAYEGEEILL